MTDVLALLQDLVAIESVSGAEQAAGDFAADVLAKGGASVTRVGASVVARVERGAGPRLLLNSHLDTVPVGTGWTRAAYPRASNAGSDWKDGALHGRGANDAKASVAAFITAFLAIAERRDFAGVIDLALTAREETDQSGMNEVLARFGMPDGGITGEPTGLEVNRAQGGLTVIVAEWSGTSCHAAHVARRAHDNALLRAAGELTRTAPFVKLDGEHPLLGASTIVVTQFRSGERHNVVPDRAEAVLDARLVPLHSGEVARARIAELLPTATVRVRSERLKAVETAADHPLVRAALAACGKTAAIGSTTVSDMALLRGVPAVKVGPGQTLRSHTPDEFVLQTEVEAGVAAYSRMIPAALAALAMPQEVRK